MEAYRKPTKYCDSDNPRITALAGELKREDERQTAIAIWRFISHIPYRFDFWNVKASETLGKFQGMCTNKANLQIALLRAVGIPAGYGWMKIRKEALEYVSHPEFYTRIAPITTHVFAYVYLDGEWVATDATRDRVMEGDTPPDPLDNRTFPWDGKTNYKKSPNYVIREEEMKANIDERLEIKPRFLTKEILTDINGHIDSLEKGVSHVD